MIRLLELEIIRADPPQSTLTLAFPLILRGREQTMPQLSVPYSPFAINIGTNSRNGTKYLATAITANANEQHGRSCEQTPLKKQPESAEIYSADIFGCNGGERDADGVGEKLAVTVPLWEGLNASVLLNVTALVVGSALTACSSIMKAQRSRSLQAQEQRQSSYSGSVFRE